MTYHKLWGTIKKCGNTEPHEPHPHGKGYSTVNDGHCDYICTGVEHDHLLRYVSEGNAHFASCVHYVSEDHETKEAEND